MSDISGTGEVYRTVAGMHEREIEVLEDSNAVLLAALRIFVEETGWRGRSDGLPIDTYECEFCAACHLDCNELLHAKTCPITIGRAAIAKATGADDATR